MLLRIILSFLLLSTLFAQQEENIFKAQQHAEYVKNELLIKRKSDITIDGSALSIGFLVLYNCDNVTVKNVDSIKIFIIGSAHNCIESCQPLEQTQFGFLLFHSSNNLIISVKVLSLIMQMLLL